MEMNSFYNSMQIERACRLFFSTPFWSDSICTGIHPSQREIHLKSLCEYLNSKNDDGLPWIYMDILKPRTIKNRKRGVVYKIIQLPKTFKNKVSSIFEENNVINIQARICYVDYGLGALEINIDVIRNSNENFISFIRKSTLVKEMVVYYLQQGAEGITPSFQLINEKISNFFDRAGISIPNQLSKQSNDHSTKKSSFLCGPIGRHLILFCSELKSKVLKIDVDEIKLASNIFMNQCSENQGITGLLSIPIYHVGYEGGVLLLNDKNCFQNILDTRKLGNLESNNSMVGHIQFLWTWTIVFWTALFTASEGLYALSTIYSLSGKYSLKEINHNLEFFDGYRKTISMIKYEFRPENVVVEGEDSILYSKLWYAYKSDELYKSLSQIDFDFEKIITSLSQKSDSLSQKRIQILFGILTIISFINVIASLIGFYDVNGEIQSFDRLKLIVCVCTIFCLLCIIYIGIVKYTLKFFKNGK